jgi:L-alanine-DL-glutamate epimerase-like enolase superfamily enzyme
MFSFVDAFAMIERPLADRNRLRSNDYNSTGAADAPTHDALDFARRDMARILDANVTFTSQPLAMPLHLSSGVIRSLTLAEATVVIQIAGREATGHGAIYLSDVWAWPDPALTREQRDQTLRELCERIAAEMPVQLRGEDVHPLELGLRLHHLACHDLNASPDPTLLARAMCASPFDAAIHDAAGIALERSAFELYDEAAAIPSADRYFPEAGACRAVAATICTPRAELDAWYIISRDDVLEFTMVPAIEKHGYRCFKLKIIGHDNDADVARTVQVYRKSLESGVATPRISIDSNEANPSADSVMDYLEKLKATDTNAYEALAYIEQPTHRDICAHPQDWRDVARQKPVMLDEGLTELDLLDEARRQGYSGFALKTCKGHSMLLVAAAWALRHSMLLSLQDLTNPGLALIHAALVGSRLPTINGAELNSPQFTPAANREYAARLPQLFEPRGGVHRLPERIPFGLGSNL